MWTAKKTNAWVLNKAGVKRELLDTVKARKLAYYAHTMRKLEGTYSLESTDPRESEIQRTEINGESTSMVWPTLGSRAAK